MTERYDLKKELALMDLIGLKKIIQLSSSQHDTLLEGETVTFRLNDVHNPYELDTICIDIPIKITKQDNSNYTGNDKIQLSNYTALSVWSEIEFLINNETIERLTNPYYSILMQKIASDTNKDALSAYTIENDNSALDGYLNKILVDSDYSLVLRLKLSDCIGYLKTPKIFIGGVLSFRLTRNKDNMIAYRLNSGDPFKVETKELKAYITQANPNSEFDSVFNKQLSSLKSISYPYLHKSIATDLVSSNKSWQYQIPVTNNKTPVSILMGFYSVNQADTDKKGIYNNVELENAYIEINSNRYPHTALEGKYHRNDYNNFFNTLFEYHNDYKGTDWLQYNLSKIQYKNIYPIIWFDLRFQQQYENMGGVTLQLKFKDDFDVANKYYCVLLIETPNDKTFQVENKMIA